MDVLVYCLECKGTWWATWEEIEADPKSYVLGPRQARLWADSVPVLLCPKHRLALAREKRELAHA